MDEKKIREAIEVIKANYPTSGYYMLRESLDIAIEALGKQLPKKVEMLTEYRDLNGNLMCFKAFCPSCGRVVESYRNKNCHVCTQVLDWSE
nr:MAG TPA: 30S ribosomal protein S11 [Caudoviricetes sp.]